MEFRQQLHIGQRLEQRLVMTQQLQQAIRLLQLSRVEMVETIREQLLENPVLEVDERARDAEGPNAISNAVTDGEGQVQDITAPENDGKEKQEIDWQEYFADLARSPREGRGTVVRSDDERPPLEATLTEEATLPEMLLEQIRHSRTDETRASIAEWIIGNLDDDGYFRPTQLVVSGGSDAGRRLFGRRAARQDIEVVDDRSSLALLWLDEETAATWASEAEAKGLTTRWHEGNSTWAIAKRFDTAVIAVHAVLRQVQRLDPVGVACRDLAESLAVQAEQRYPDEALLHAVIGKHLPSIEARRPERIVRAEKTTKDEVKRALALLATLDPRPGRQFLGEKAAYITPDVYVHKVGDEYKVIVNDDGLPKLRVSQAYQNALTGGAGKEAKDYLSEKMRAATWLIRSIQQRQNTIQRVTEAIMRVQRPFLEQGVKALKPLVLREIADEVGLHESTVSRVTTNKYVHTPQGIYELKFFFNSRITTAGSGADMASEAVKHRIKRLIEHEQPRHPLSDQELADILGGKKDRARVLSRLDCAESKLDELIPAQAMRIARRTVAKYREALNIPSSSRRRQTL